MLPDPDTWLWEAYETLRTALTTAIEPLEAYRQTFRQFEYEHGLDPNKYMRQLDERDEPIDAEELRVDIYEKKDEEAKLKAKIPEMVTVSIFSININDIRNMYSGKYQ